MALELPVKFNIATWFVDRPAQEHPQRTAILGEPTAVSYRELCEQTNRAGNALKGQGCKPGDRVLIALPDSVEFIAVFFGAAKVGAIAVPVNPFATTSEFSHYLADSGAQIAIIHACALPQFSPALAGMATRFLVAGRDPAAQDSELSWEDCIDSSAPMLEAYPTAACDPAFFLYTSGSTGLPKAAVHEHKNMLVTTRSFAQGVLDMGPDDRPLSIPKLFFGYGLGNGMYFPLGVGASTILNPDIPRPDRVAWFIERYKPTILFAVPTFLRAFYKELENGLQVDLSSIRLVVYGGEPTPPELFEQFHKRFRLEMIEGLGSTEVGQTFISNRPGQARAGTCGVEVPNYEVRLIGEDGQAVSEGEVGALWVKGESVFLGYWNRPELTARTKHDGWVITGDKLYRDALGSYHFCGRGDNMIKISGMWVSPQQVEFVLDQHPAVEQAVVTTVGGASEPKRLVAYVMSREGSEWNSGELRRYLSERVSEHMIPNVFVAMPEFSLTGSGKIDRASLPNPPAGTEDDRRHSDFIGPRTPTEKKLADILSAVLDIPEIGLFDDFLSLGGTSVLALQCLSRIRGAFQVDLPLNTLFEEEANISELAKMIDKMRPAGAALELPHAPH